MELSRHVIVWISCVTLIAFAPTLVRLYVRRLERRARDRSDELLAVLPGLGGACACQPEPNPPKDASVT